MDTTGLRLLIGTRKGAFYLDSAIDRKQWTLNGPHLLGHIIYHIVADPRKPGSLLMAAKTGHLGPTLYRSIDGGENWAEASGPPAFPKAPEGEKGRAVDATFWLTPGHASQDGTWFAGTTPPGLFQSSDHGDTWHPVSGFNDAADYSKWAAFGATPGGHLLHSIIVDPLDANHLLVSISVGGTFESIDGGASWKPLNKGCEAEFLPDANAEFGHDPHCVVMHPADSGRLYQQNHCGIYRLDSPSREWVRIGRNMPKEVGDIGFPIVPHPRDKDRVWVFPMDGTTVWPRTSPDGKPAVYATTDGGRSWLRQDKGLPQQHAYLTVKRQAMTADKCASVGLYFGTTGGEVWGSADEGANWKCLARHLPEIYSLTVMER